MYINTQTFSNIVRAVIKEQDLSLLSNPNRSEIYKKILLYTEYVIRYYTLIKEHRDSLSTTPLSPIDIYKSVLEFLKNIVSDPEFVQIQNLLKGIVAKGAQEYGKSVPVLSNALQYLITFFNSYDDSASEADKLAKYASFNKYFDLYFNSITKLLNAVRTKFSDNATKDVSTKALPGLGTINYINDLENISLLYLSEIETLFKKFDNIRIESGEYSKKWEDFNILRGHDLYIKGANLQNNSDPDFSDKVKKTLANHFRKTLQPNHDVSSSKTYSFNIEAFIQILFNIDKYKSHSKYSGTTSTGTISLQRELEKAKSIQESLLKIFGWNSAQSKITKESIEGTLQEKFKEIHSKLWKPAEGKYEYDSELRQIFQILLNVRKLYKKMLNKVVSTMTTLKGKDLSEIFKKIGPVIDAIIKYVQFAKLNIRNVMLNLITNSGVKMDVAKYHAMFSKQNDETVSKRLAYWALFQRLGWTKGLKNGEEAPDWIYGNAIKAETPSPTPVTPPVSSPTPPAPTP